MCSNKVWAHVFFLTNRNVDERLPINSGYVIVQKSNYTKSHSKFHTLSTYGTRKTPQCVCCFAVAAVKLLESPDVCCVCFLVALKVIWSQVRRVDHLWKSICE